MGAMLCCCCTRTTAVPGKYGMVANSERKCRDTLCCLFFFLFWVGMVVIAGVAFHKGHPTRLLYGTDYLGRTCGEDEVHGLKYITYPRTAEDYLINLGVNPLDMKFYGVCVSACPHQFDVVCNSNPALLALIAASPALYSQANMLACANRTSPAPAGVACNTVIDNCWVTPVDTVSTLFHCLPVKEYNQTNVAKCIFPSTVTSALSPFCVLAEESVSGTVQKPAHQNLVFEYLSTGAAVWSRYFGDIQRTWYVIVICGVLVAMVLSLVWLLLMKWFTFAMVVLAIVLTVCICIAITLFCYFKAGILDATTVSSFTDQVSSTYSNKLQDSLTASEQNKTRFKIAAYVFTVITILIVCVAVALRKSIATAVNVIKLGVRAVGNAPGVLIFPVFTVVLLVSLLIWWVFVAAAMASSGTITLSDLAPFNSTFSSLPSLNTNFSVVKDDNIMKYLLIYHFFGLLWTNQFIQGIGMVTIAGACSGWYFSCNETLNPDVEKLRYAQPRFATLASFLRTVRYSLGSIAFGGLLIAIVQAVRAALAYAQRQSKQLAEGNRAVKALVCCVQCCLKALQAFIEVVTRNAYIYIALKGSSFCEAGRNVFSIMSANIMVLAVVNLLSEIIAFLGKVLVSCASGFICFWYVERTAKFGPGGTDEVSSSWLPVILSMLFAYCVSSGFLYVYDMAVDSMLVCHILDCEENADRNGGSSAHKVPVHFKHGLVANLDASKPDPSTVVVTKPGGGATAPGGDGGSGAGVGGGGYGSVAVAGAAVGVGAGAGAGVGPRPGGAAVDAYGGYGAVVPAANGSY